MKKARIFTISVFLFIFIGLLIRNIQYSDHLFHDWDEGIYATVASEMLENASLTTTFNGEIWLNKPPLSHALIALLFALFGENEFPARFLMQIFAMWLIILLYYLTKQAIEVLFKDTIQTYSPFHKEVVYLIPVLALIPAPLFIERALVLNTDVMLAVAWVGYFLSHNSYVLKVFYLAFGVLSKSLVGFYPVFVELFTIQKKRIYPLNIVKVLVLITIPISWHIISYLRFGDFFIQAHVLDQMVKRVVAPIELHFGGRLFYPMLLWENIGLLTLFVLLAYTLAGLSLLGLLYSKRWKIQASQEWWYYLIIFSPVPFFLLLTFGKSKIGWYLITLLPLITLSLSYVYMKARYAFIRLVLLGTLLFAILFGFIPKTYLFSADYQPPENLVMAKCLRAKNGSHITVFVSSQERQNRNVVEAAQLQTATSFLYGGSPSFAFYIDKKIDYVYKPDERVIDFTRTDLVMITKEDYKKRKATAKQIRTNFTKVCETESWLGFSKE